MADLEQISYSDAKIRSILERVRTIALVGASPNWNRPSYFVMKYLQGKGYRVIPVNPGIAGKTVLGEKAYASLRDIPERVPAVLKAMRRPAAQEKTLERIRAWRAICPDLTIRSTFIVGFPGETEEDFRFLIDWLDEAKLHRVGAFQYEPVKGAAANDLGLAPVPDEIKASRHNRFMQRAQAISLKKLAAKVGRRLEVIIDEGGARQAKGRTKGDAPQIDGAVHILTRRPLRAGDIATVKIERSDAYDLWGTAV